jgi:hypothetical protein
MNHFLEAEDVRVVELRHELDFTQRRQGKLSRATESPGISDDEREHSCINGSVQQWWVEAWAGGWHAYVQDTTQRM